MPTETEVTDQIKVYALWLEATLDTDLVSPTEGVAEVGPRSSFAPTLEPELIGADGGSTSEARRLGSLGLVLAAIAVVVGVVMTAHRSDSPVVVAPVAELSRAGSESVTSSTLPTEPADANQPEEVATLAPLFVLPGSLDGFSVVDGAMSEVASGDVGSAIVVGREEPGGFSDVGVVFFVQELSFAGSEEEFEIDGTIFQVADRGLNASDSSIGLRVPSGGWLEVTATTRQQAVELALASGVSEGTLVFNPFDGLDVVGSIDTLEAGRTRFLSLRDQQVSGFLTIIVQASPGQLGLPPLPGDVERVAIRGVEGFRGVADSPMGYSSTVMSWLEQPGQLITVVGGGPVNVEQVAESVRVVDEETWFAELESLPVFDSLQSVVGLPIGTFVFLDEEGDEVQFEANGEPIVVVAGSSSCANCSIDIDTLSSLVEQSHPGVRIVVVGVEDDDDWIGPESWEGPVYSLPERGVDLGPFGIADSLASGELLVLDGSHETVARIDSSQADAVGRLHLVLELLG